MNFHVFPIEHDGIFQPVKLVVNIRGFHATLAGCWWLFSKALHPPCAIGLPRPADNGWRWMVVKHWGLTTLPEKKPRWNTLTKLVPASPPEGCYLTEPYRSQAGFPSTIFSASCFSIGGVVTCLGIPAHIFSDVPQQVERQVERIIVS